MCVYVCMYARTYVCMYVCLHAGYNPFAYMAVIVEELHTHICILCMHVYVYVLVCVYASMSTYMYLYVYNKTTYIWYPPPKIYQSQCYYRHCWLLSPPRLSRGLLAEPWIPIETD